MNFQNFQTQILKIVASQLKGDYSDSMTRFSYINGGANIFLQLIHNPDYLGYDREIILLNKIVPKIRRINNSFTQIIDLGPGDGTKASKIVRLLSTQSLEYFALDISNEMLSIAKHEFKNSGLEGRFKICDWHDPISLKGTIKQNNAHSNLILLLGNTLTNEINMQEFLTNLKKAIEFLIRPNYLLIGLEISDGNINEIIKEYKNEINCSLTVRPLEMVGVSKSDGIVDIKFNKKLRRIEEWFISTGKKNIESRNFDISLHAGSRILLSVTYKPTEESIRKIFRESGWNILFSDFEEDQGMFLLSSR